VPIKVISHLKAIQFVIKISQESENDNKKMGKSSSSSSLDIGQQQYEMKFNEIELGDVIGKGYFGEVRKAKWNGILNFEFMREKIHKVNESTRHTYNNTNIKFVI
jgi:hypothetical protein